MSDADGDGTEFTRHGLLANSTGMATWLRDAYPSWHKGGIENANSRISRHLSRGLDIDSLSTRRCGTSS